MPQSIYPIIRAEIARARKSFQHPLLTSKPATMTQSAETTIPPYQHYIFSIIFFFIYLFIFFYHFHTLYYVLRKCWVRFYNGKLPSPPAVVYLFQICTYVSLANMSQSFTAVKVEISVLVKNSFFNGTYDVFLLPTLNKS